MASISHLFRAALKKKIKALLSFSFQHNHNEAINDCDEGMKDGWMRAKWGECKNKHGGLRYSLCRRSDKHAGPFGVISHNTVSEVKGHSCHAGSGSCSSSRPHCWNRRQQNISRWSVAKETHKLLLFANLPSACGGTSHHIHWQKFANCVKKSSNGFTFQWKWRRDATACVL